MRTAVIVWLSTLTCGLAAPLARASEPDPAPILRVTGDRVSDCNTDGGPVACSPGTQTLAKGVGVFVDQLQLACPGVKKKTKYKLVLLYEYNDGTVFYFSHPLAELHMGKLSSTPVPADDALTDGWGKPLKKKPGLPACLVTALPKIGEQLLLWLDVLRQIDPETDVRATYELNLRVE